MELNLKMVPSNGIILVQNIVPGEAPLKRPTLAEVQLFKLN